MRHSLGRDKGSTFFLWVPCEEQLHMDGEISDEETTQHVPLVTRARSVLLVDDNAVNQLVIK